MINYVNVGPGRSGTTSFYNMCLNDQAFNCGKVKEPVRERWKKIEGSEDYHFDVESYINNWEYNKSDNTTLLDSSGQVMLSNRLKEFKSYMNDYVDSFKFILLVRNPTSYLSSRIYTNSFQVIKDESPSINWTLSPSFLATMKKIFETKFKELHHIKRFYYLSFLERASSILNKDEIFILPIEFFDDYKTRLSEFLNIDCSNLIFPHYKTTSRMGGWSEKSLVFKKMIEDSVHKNKELKEDIKENFKQIDSEYGSDLCNLYLK